MAAQKKLEDKILLQVTKYASIMSLIATFTNLGIGLFIPAIVSATGFIVFWGVYRILNSQINNTLNNTLIIILLYIYCITIWFFNAGADGNAILLFIVLFFISFVVFPSHKHPFFIVCNILLIISLYALEYYYPQSILDTYRSNSDRFIDITAVAIFILFMLKIVVDIVRKEYNEEKQLVEEKNNELEKSKTEIIESNTFFNKLTENLPGVSYQFKMYPNGRTSFTYVSGAIENIYEVTAAQVYKNQHILTKMLSPLDKKTFFADVKYSFDNLTYFKNEHQLILPSGKIKYISTQAKPEKLSDGTVVWYGYSKDVTERVLEDKKLQLSEGKFRFISENTSDGIVVLENGRISYVSESYTKILGYTKEEQFVRNKSDILQLIHAEDKFRLIRKINESIIKKEKNLVIEYRYLHKKGHYIWREDNINFTYNDKRKPRKFVILVRDITAQRKARLEFEQIKVMLEQTSSIAKVGGWELDLLTKKMLCTDLIYEIHELDKSHSLTFHAIISFFKKGYSRTSIKGFLTQLFYTTEDYDQELELITAKGNRKWVRVIGKALIENGNCIKVFGTLQDITQQKQIDSKLKELALVASKTNDAVIITDANTTISWVNAAFENLTGYLLNEVIGKQQKDFLYGAQTSLETVQKMENEIHAFKPLKTILLNYTKSGTPIWFDISVTPVFDTSGVCTNFIEVKKDITERMEKQQQLQTLTDVTADQNKRLLNFAYIVSHNIRSHSANLTGLISMIEHSNTKEEKETLFNLLKVSTDKLEETIQNLNEIITIQTNLNQAKTQLNLRKEIERTFFVINDIVLESKAIVINQVDSETSVNAVPAYLDSILLNLFTNAIKYSSPDRIPQIKLSTYLEGDYLVLSVSDNGLGLDLNRLKDKLFGMYKTFHDNANARGIGLFITKNQIEAMNGKIEVESEVNVGTTFKIFFPTRL